MGELYGVARKHDIPVVLVVFPFTYQLAAEDLRVPQEILAEHAATFDVPVIDLTEDFARAVFDDPELVAYLRSKGKTSDEILAYHRHLADKYFFDEDHFTDAGHRIVAQKLYDWLIANGYAG
jgi:lysophospholipase L1-like esterase